MILKEHCSCFTEIAWTTILILSTIVPLLPAQAFQSLLESTVNDEDPSLNFNMSQILAMNLTRKATDAEQVPHRRLTYFLLDENRYNKRIRPVYDHTKPVEIHLVMSLYQIIQVNEPEQTIKMNIWMIQSWVDELLGWNPEEYGGIESLILPHSSLWIPDTYVYNSDCLWGIREIAKNTRNQIKELLLEQFQLANTIILFYERLWNTRTCHCVVMGQEETERHMNTKLTTLHKEGKSGAKISFLYPAIYTTTCHLNVRYFPYDLQNCTLVIGSWTYDSSALDYSADFQVNMASYIDNEEWKVESFTTYRHVTKYQCCPRPWIMLRAHLVIRRKPLYYLVNLIVPTSIITLVAITGFFTPASTDEDRKEKINLGITTLLAMSILMLIVSDVMPTTSKFIPLIAWFYVAVMGIISLGTFTTTLILSVHARRTSGQLPSNALRRLIFGYLARWLRVDPPPVLSSLWNELEDDPRRSFPSNKNDDSVTISISDSTIYKSTILKHSQELTEVGQSTLAKVTARKSWAFDSNIPDLADNNKLKFPQIETSENAESSSWGYPRPQTVEIRSRGMWSAAFSLAGLRNSCSDQAKDKPKTSRVSEVKKKRQCFLEWEFIATFLDRLFLIMFSISVIFITIAFMLIGSRAHREF